VKPKHYILIGQTAVPEPRLEKWAAWFEHAARTVAVDEVASMRVSTVFLGLDHQFGKGPPLLFETMVFCDGGDEMDCARCSTWAEAEAQHKRILEHVRNIAERMARR
jgi:hypothetical protein